MSRSAALLLAALAFPFATLAQDIDTRTANNGNVILEQVPDVPLALVEQLNRYQAVRSAGFNDWTADGQGVYITTRFGDVRQVHRVDMPGGARQQLTFFREPAGGVSRRPGRAEFSYSMDEGGSEFYQLFLYDLETGEVLWQCSGQTRNVIPSPVVGFGKVFCKCFNAWTNRCQFLSKLPNYRLKLSNVSF